MEKDDRPVVIVDKVTRNVIMRFPSSREAADAMGMKRATARKMVLRKTASRVSRWFMRFEDDYVRDEDLSENMSCAPVYAMRGDRIRFFYSTGDAAAALHTSAYTVSRYVRDGSGMGLKWGRIPRGIDSLLSEMGVANGG